MRHMRGIKTSEQYTLSQFNSHLVIIKIIFYKTANATPHTLYIINPQIFATSSKNVEFHLLVQEAHISKKDGWVSED